MKAVELNVPELNDPELKMPELKVPELNVPELGTPELKMPELKAPRATYTHTHEKWRPTPILTTTFTTNQPHAHQPSHTHTGPRG